MSISICGLHDVGKIALPDGILLKPGKLTPEEFEIMKCHPGKGREMINLMISEFGLDGIHHTYMLTNIIASHHERFDGIGYPLGLAGEDIPLAARILAVADDVFDALPASAPTSSPGRSIRPLPIWKSMPAASSIPPVLPRACATKPSFMPFISSIRIQPLHRRRTMRNRLE